MHDLTRRPRRISNAIETPSQDVAGPGSLYGTPAPGGCRFRATHAMRSSTGANGRAGDMGRIEADLATLSRRVSLHTPDNRLADSEFVIARLEEAGATLLSLPESGFSPRMRNGALQAVHSAAEAYGWSAARLRPPVPSPERITRMDETFAWLALVPADRAVLRRLVSARSLVSPLTGKHLYAWRRLAGLIGADHKAVQRWHAEGIRLIVQALNR